MATTYTSEQRQAQNLAEQTRINEFINILRSQARQFISQANGALTSAQEAINPVVEQLNQAIKSNIPNMKKELKKLKTEATQLQNELSEFKEKVAKRVSVAIENIRKNGAQGMNEELTKFQKWAQSTLKTFQNKVLRFSKKLGALSVKTANLVANKAIKLAKQSKASATRVFSQLCRTKKQQKSRKKSLSTQQPCKKLRVANV